MAIVVGVMDRDSWSARTDILVRVDPVARALCWIPRDLYSPLLGDRINKAYQRGGFGVLLEALGQLGFPCSEGVCVRRSLAIKLLADLQVTVPVETELRFKYPIAPERAIEEGFKYIKFSPPEALLSGERIHQWIGARYCELGPPEMQSDLGRLLRQQILLREILRGKPNAFTDARYLATADGIVATSAEVYRQLAAINQDWNCMSVEGLVEQRIENRLVLVLATDPPSKVSIE